MRGRIVAHDAHTLDSGEQEGSETIGETIAGWISRRLDQVAREQHPDGRHCLRYDGDIPGIAPVVLAVEAAFGQLARDYLGNDTFLSHYSAFRLPSNLDLANCPYRQPAWRARCCARYAVVPVALQPSATTHTVSHSWCRDAQADPAGFYHHDRCGHRLKAYLMLTHVTEDSCAHPPCLRPTHCCKLHVATPLHAACLSAPGIRSASLWAHIARCFIRTTTCWHRASRTTTSRPTIWFAR